MKRFVPLLLVLLVIQGGLIVYTRFSEGHKETAPNSLVTIDSGAIDHIVISDDEHKEVKLSKKDKGWIIDNHFNGPADSIKIKTDLETIASLKNSWPVATSASASERFHVGEKNFKRKIVLQEGSQTKATIYLGDANGPNGSFARVNKESDIIPVSLTQFDYSTDADKWLDHNLLQIPLDTITAVKLNDISLHRDKDAFILDNAKNEQVDQNKVQKLLKRISNVTIQGLLGAEPDPVYQLDKPALTVHIDKKDGKTTTYLFGKPDKARYYVLKPSDKKFFFKIAEWQATDLLSSTQSELMKKEVKPAPVKPAD